MTTGRINQVATLSDTARRTCKAAPRGQPCRHEHGCHPNKHTLQGTSKVAALQPSHALHPKEQHALMYRMSPQQRVAQVGQQDNQGVPRVPNNKHRVEGNFQANEIPFNRYSTQEPTAQKPKATKARDGE